MGSTSKKLGLVVLHLTETGPNYFVESATDTSFTFLTPSISTAKAKRRAEALMKVFANVGRLDRFYGRH